MSIPIFTADDIQARHRSNRALTARLYASSDYQEWLSRVLRPKLATLQAEVMNANLLSDEGRIEAARAQIAYQALVTYLEDEMKTAGVAESSYQRSLSPESVV